MRKSFHCTVKEVAEEEVEEGDVETGDGWQWGIAYAGWLCCVVCPVDGQQAKQKNNDPPVINLIWSIYYADSFAFHTAKLS